MKRVGIALLTIGIALTLCGCGGERQSVPEPDDADSSVVGNGQKVAGSMEEYIDQALSWQTTTDKERKVLEQAKQDGELSVSDYEQAWSDFKSCMVERGYPPFELANYNGIYDMPQLHLPVHRTSGRDTRMITILVTSKSVQSTQFIRCKWVIPTSTRICMRL